MPLLDSIITIVDENYDKWYYGSMIAKIMGYTDPKRAISHCVDIKDTKKYGDFDFNKVQQIGNVKYGQKIQSITKFINYNGLEDLLLTCKSAKSIRLAKELKMRINTKIVAKETTIAYQLETFFTNCNIKYFLNKSVRIDGKLYRPDIYLPKHKIIIEIDENGHADRNEQYEIKRQNAVEKKLKTRFIRINPDDKNFNIFSELGAIMKIIDAKEILIKAKESRA